MTLSEAVEQARKLKKNVRHKNWKKNAQASPDFLDAASNGLVEGITIDTKTANDKMWEIV